MRGHAASFCWGAPVWYEQCEISYHSDMNTMSWSKGCWLFTFIQLTRRWIVIGDVYKAVWRLYWCTQQASVLDYLHDNVIVSVKLIFWSRILLQLSDGKSVLDLPTPRFDAGRAFAVLGDTGTSSPLVSFVRFLLVEGCCSGQEEANDW